MAARKLQSEIDRTLKKVSEGVELFENIYDKMQASTNQTQKEKQELDLKTQIKKLQRLRDQIKTWVASNDIKDKSALLDNRRLIETQMEKFKACEKEMKTKAFSKEGLIQATKLDPKEQEKEDAMQWLQQQVEELQMQVESTEAEVESLQSSSKKKNKGGVAAAERLEVLERLNERRKWHINRLELILRLTNNGSLTADKVNGLREDVQYFVTSNTEDDFDEDDGIYEELNLDEAEGEFGFAAEEDDDDSSDEASEDTPPPKSAKKHDEDSTPSHKRDESPILKKAAVSLAARKHSVDTKPPPNLSFAQQPMSSVLKATLPAPPRPAAPTALPPIRYAAAAAAAVSANPPSSSASSAVPVTPVTPSVAQAIAQIPVSSIPPSVPLQEHVTPSPSLTQASVTSPVVSSAASISQPSDGSPPQTASSRKGSVSAPSPVVSVQPVAAQPTEPTVPEQRPSEEPVPRAIQQAPSPLPPPIQAAPSVAAAVNSPLPTPAVISQQQVPAFPPGVKITQNEQAAATVAPQAIGGQRPSSTQQPAAPGRTPSSAFPGSLSDLVVSFENVKQKALRVSNLDQVHKMLEGGHINVPQPQDTDKPKYYVPRNPYHTPAYYPQQPHPTLASPAIFSQLDVETLFYIFYYLPGTYQQYLAAKELKRQSWRFHVKYLTWFQRHSEPQAITEDYEQGVYVYFDWEGSWCQRKKGDFRFEYRYLSED